MRLTFGRMAVTGLALMFALSSGFAQNEAELRDIRSEINRLQRKLDASQSNLRNAVSTLETIEKQSTLQKKSLTLLQREIKKNRNLVSSLGKSIDSLENSIEAIEKVLSKQIVFMYKYSRKSSLEWILGAESLNQALVRYQYFYKIGESVRRVHTRLSEKREKLLSLNEARQRELGRKENLFADKNRDQKALDAQRSERQKIVKRISNDKKLLEASLREKQRSFEKLKNLIGSLQVEKESGELQERVNIDWGKVGGDFAAQRGRLNWPVRGKVLTKFGNYRNPELKTTLVSNGIDIAATRGSAVKCVFSGVASHITYMSGFGNTLIVDHNNGFYTVYSHLDQVSVQKYEALKPGDTIGTVGDSGSLSGARLHFEIYSNNKPVDPLRWLNK